MYKFAILIFYFASFLSIIEGVSLIFRQKGFDIIAYIFYDEEYQDINIIDLTAIPYWVSLLLGLFFMLLPAWVYIRDTYNV